MSFCYLSCCFRFLLSNYRQVLDIDNVHTHLSLFGWIFRGICERHMSSDASFPPISVYALIFLNNFFSLLFSLITRTECVYPCPVYVKRDVRDDGLTLDVMTDGSCERSIYISILLMPIMPYSLRQADQPRRLTTYKKRKSLIWELKAGYLFSLLLYASLGWKGKKRTAT